jgi:hypothetical protein
MSDASTEIEAMSSAAAIQRSFVLCIEKAIVHRLFLQCERITSGAKFELEKKPLGWQAWSRSRA